MSVISGVVGALTSSNSASNAADATLKASQNAQDTALQMYNQNRADLAPWRTAGGGALDVLAQRMGLGNPSASGPPVAPDRAQFMTNPTGNYFANLIGGGTGSIPGINSGYINPGGDSSQTPSGGGNAGPTFDQTGYDAAMAQYQQQLQAYNTGQANWSKDPNFGSLLTPFSKTNWQTDPGYQFRIGEGARGVENSAAAKGGFFSGNTGVALDQYNQDFASNEYNNVYNRYNMDQTNVFNRLSGLAGTGQQATSTTASLGANAAGNVGNYLMSGAQTAGQDYIAAGNAMASGLQGIGNQALGAYGAYNQNKNYQSLLALLQQGGGGGGGGVGTDITALENLG